MDKTGNTNTFEAPGASPGICDTVWSPIFTCFKSLSVFCFTGVLRLPLWLYNCLICIYLSNQCLSHLIVLFLCLSPCIHVFSIDKIDSLYITEILYSLSTKDPINLSCFVLSTWTVILLHLCKRVSVIINTDINSFACFILYRYMYIMFGRGICVKYQSRDEKFPEPKYPSQTWYICLITPNII